MPRRKKLFIRPFLLVLMLLLGPVHAQTMFACAMMDAVVHDKCCCDDHEQCIDSDCDDALEADQEPCCEQSVELSINHETDQSSPAIKPLEVRSDVDPPTAIVVVIDLDVHSHRILMVENPRHIGTAQHPGSNTYLITQRLRL